jgi:hypothetical protein
MDSKAAERELRAKEELIDLIEAACARADLNTHDDLIRTLSEILYPDREKAIKGTRLKEDLSRTNDKLPTLNYLLGVHLTVHEARGQAGDRPSMRELQQWLSCWLAARLEELQNFSAAKNGKKNAFRLPPDRIRPWLAAAEDLKRKLNLPAGSGRRGSGSHPTLDQFPEAFTPLTIVTGNAHSFPPRRLEDLFRRNARFSDLLHLCRLNPDPSTLIVPDSYIVGLDVEERMRLLGNRHLLVIGGPSVNAVTRALYKVSPFSLRFQEQRDAFDAFFDYLKNSQLLKSEPHVELLHEFLDSDTTDYNADSFRRRRVNEADRRDLCTLAQVIRRAASEPGYKLPPVEKLRTEKLTGEYGHINYARIIELFSPREGFDPVALEIRAAPVSHDGDDHTLISLAPNLWDRADRNDDRSFNYKYFSIIVAGFQELGTAIGLKALSNRPYLRRHPLGGFLRTAKGSGDNELERILEGHYEGFGENEWKQLTPPYGEDIAKIHARLCDELDTSRGKRVRALHHLTNEDLDMHCKFWGLYCPCGSPRHARPARSGASLG